MTPDHPLKEWRKRIGRFSDRDGEELSQKALADELGIVPSHLSQIESGLRSPSLSLAMSLAKLTGLSVQEIAGKTE